MSKKTKAASLSVLSNTLLILLKLVAGILSGSVSIISEAIHSFMDLLAAIIAYISVRISDRPADERHPYGHWKIENISGVIEALLIFVAAIWIIYEAVRKILKPTEIETIGLGFAVMLISAAVNTFVSWYLYKVAKSTGSVALEADALHLKADVYTSLGVASGLGLIWLTGYHLLDPIVALLVSILILKESYTLLMKAYKPLLDESLDIDEIKIIRSIIDKYCKENIKYHGLRTRRAGNFRYVDFHLNLDENLTVRDAHELCDRIEADIKQFLVNSEVTIHVEHF
ncbi:MAG: cation diffusion facilitator family transporter [Bacteroidetes bacterium]|nr:cation diffusion facilitator family transporter [Bacteroidota bacterium]